MGGPGGALLDTPADGTRLYRRQLRHAGHGDEQLRGSAREERRGDLEALLTAPDPAPPGPVSVKIEYFERRTSENHSGLVRRGDVQHMLDDVPAEAIAAFLVWEV